MVRISGKSDFRDFFSSLRVGRRVSQKNLAIFWIYGLTDGPSLDVATLEEARSCGGLMFKERCRGGVPELIVGNWGETYVLLMRGDIIIGEIQDRVVLENILLPPRSGPWDLHFFSVEQGRRGGRRWEIEVRGIFDEPAASHQVVVRTEQERLLRRAAAFANRFSKRSNAHANRTIVEQADVEKHLQDISQEVDPPDSQGPQGAAVFIDDSLAGVDLFEGPSLFRREWPKLIRAYALMTYGMSPQKEGDLQQQGNLVDGLLRAAAKAEIATRDSIGAGSVLEFEVAGYHGTALVSGSHFLHTALLQ